ncbi:histidine--tRNA ligase [Christensenellaceae bacterium OttesenSCG-928-L17]|nr:histidine--tRNA ligase [Christensenellaceae bacterium OttesenSCG-928-L17]
MSIQKPKGTQDIAPLESYKWHYVEGLVREICEKYGLKEARTPVFEHTELFLRGVGDTTDIVQKEMYTFMDKGNRSITLKPEGTAGIVRMFVEEKLYNEPQPTKMYYLYCPVFRYERPQAGRLREHHQFGIELFGAPRASADAECISIALELFERVGIRDLSVHINSIGCPNCRPSYHEALKTYFRAHYDELCDTCRTRFEKNPLRILDCKEKRCKEIAADAPIILDYLCEECEDHMQELKVCLDMMGVTYGIDPFIVRGLDYYTKTVFEIISTHIGSQGTVCGGGRYDGLIEEIGGPKMPGVGFGLGMERLLLVAESQGVDIPKPKPFDLYVASIGEQARLRGYALAWALRNEGLKVECDHVGRSIKAQFKFADKLNARYVAVLGEAELAEEKIKLKDMETGEEVLLPLDVSALAAALNSVK